MTHAARENCSSPSRMIFQKVTSAHREIIFGWLDKPHVKEFWDNSLEHRDDIDHFIGGRVGPSPYFKGVTTYWIGFMDQEPFCFILTSDMGEGPGVTQAHQIFFSQTGRTSSIDFCIGNETYLGKGLAAPTLKAFMAFFVKEVDPKTDTFFIDPDENNPRAKHVYEKAGFRDMDTFTVTEGHFKGHTSHLMTRRVYPEPQLIPAVMNDYSTIQNMARFYVYDGSRACGDLPGWECPKDGLFECFDLAKYFEEKGRYAFLVKIAEEIAGFVLIHTFDDVADWVLGEFFILAKFQGQGIGRKVAFQVFEKFPGKWNCAAIPQNTPARHFWEKTIGSYTKGQYQKSVGMVTNPGESSPHPMVMWQFES